mmetsp:Transcript_75387/g.143498  ORF Transcript_75387/g.143498 Transcript_75387/m.143498 type:complete len:307 (+) Transcript_75387:27-947(+)
MVRLPPEAADAREARRLHRRVRRGLPAEQRWEIWRVQLLQSGYAGPHREILRSDIIHELLVLESLSHDEIAVGVQDAFDATPNFDNEHRRSLCRVLNAYAFLSPDIGYRKGMSAAAGLIHFVNGGREEETLRAFVCLMEVHGLRNFFLDDSPMLQQYVLLCEQLIGNNLPDLAQHFASENILLSSHLCHWFLTFFTTCLPLPTVLVIWDGIVCTGLHTIVFAVIALLESVQQVLLTMQHEEIQAFFRSMKDSDDSAAADMGHLILRKCQKLDVPPEIAKQLGVPESPKRGKSGRGPPEVPSIEAVA